MERAKISGSLDLPPELLEVMQALQDASGGLGSRESSVSGRRRHSNTSRVSAPGAGVLVRVQPYQLAA